jgi:pilus assembly protein CpaC
MRNTLFTAPWLTAPACGLIAASLVAGPAIAARRPAAAAAQPEPSVQSASAQPVPANAAQAQPASTHAALIVEAGSGRVVTLPAPVTNVFVSDPKVVEVRPASPTSLFVFGVSAGRTTVAALDANGQTVRQYEVTVRSSGFGATEASGAIARTAPGSSVRVEAQPRRLTVTGKVPTPADAQSAEAAASAFATEGQAVDNRTKVSGQIQVGLHVRIAEMSRSVTRNLGINWQALGQIGQIGKLVALSYSSGLNTAAAATISCAGGAITTACQGATFSGLIDALAQDNLAHVLAEPNLTAISGEPASFLVGGEFPIPVAQSGNNNSVTIEFKQYGIGLSFVPTVMSEDRIRLHVRPEVSQLSSQGAVTMNGITIPALTVRRADTTVEVGSGQSFAIAGLLSDQTNDAANAIPALGEVPVLGALFRSSNFQRNETELVIIVTPYIMRPTNDPNALKLPTDGFQAPSDIERLLLLRQVGRATPDLAQRLPGQAGFVVE